MRFGQVGYVVIYDDYALKAETWVKVSRATELLPVQVRPGPPFNDQRYLHIEFSESPCCIDVAQLCYLTSLFRSKFTGTDANIARNMRIQARSKRTGSPKFPRTNGRTTLTRW